MTKKRQKNGSLNRDLLNFLYRYGIFWMPPGESSHPGGSEYVWQRGVEGVLGRVTSGQSSPSFQKKLPTFRCHKKIVGDQFFVTPHIFANGTHFVTLDRLQATKTGSKLCCTPLS